MPKKYDAAVVDALLAGQGDATALAWLADGSGDLSTVDAGVALAAIEAATRTQAVAQLQTLERAPKELKKAARRALHKLKTQGVDVAKAPARSFSLGAQPIDPDPRALVGPPNPEGYSEFLMLITDHDGTCVIMGEFGGENGLRSLSHGHVSRGQSRQMLRELTDQAPYMVEVPFAEALHHVLPAVDQAKALTGDVPHDWGHFAGHVGDALHAQAQAADPVALLAPELDEIQLSGSSHLANDPWFTLWPVHQGLMEELVSNLAARVAQEEDTDTPADFTQALSELAARGLEDEGIRNEWIRRAALASTCLRAAGEDDRARMAANIARAIQDGVPTEQIGLVERNMQLTLGYMASQGAQEQQQA